METKTTKTFEFKTRTTYDGQYWFTEINGSYITGSLNHDKDKAYAFFLKLVEESDFTPKTETLETIIK